MLKNKVILSTITLKEKYIPLGLYNLKAYFQTYRELKNKILIDIDIIDYKKYVYYQKDYWPLLDKKTLFNFASCFVRKKPKIIGFSCFIWNMNSVLKLCRLIKNLDSKIIILLGGPEVSFDSERLLKKSPYIDMVIRDEGEITFSELLRSIFLNKLDLSEIHGLIYRIKNKIIINPIRTPLDLNKIPSPYLNGLINPNKFNNLTMSIETSRGCPFNCAYCSYSIRGNHLLRFFPTSRVKKELTYLLSRKVGNLWLIDDNFNINPQRAIEILRHINKYKLINTKIDIFINASMWPINDKLIKLLKKANIRSSVGIQSINKKALLIINRKNNIPVLERNLKKFDHYKLDYILQFIAALPGDSYKDLKKNIDWVSEFNPDQIQLFLLRLIRGTDLYRNAKQLNLRFKHRYLQYQSYVKETNEIKKKDMVKVKKLINSIELLYNMKLLKNTLFFLKKYHFIKFSDLLEDWGCVVKIIILNKQYLSKIQAEFIKYVCNKYKIKISSVVIEKLLKKDLKIF